MQAKLRQINEFVRLVDETGAFDAIEQPVRVVDFGSGKGYLTMALYFYLTEIRKLRAEVTGVDLKGEVLEKLNRRAEGLGWDGLRFVTGRIEDYRPETAPQVVVALHACDTATEDALAQGLAWGCKLIVTAPCCQHYLQAQLAERATPEPFGAVMRHGILFERMGDILTDSLRAAYLRVWGYRTEVIQFVSTEHTAKNLMIRAVKTHTGIDRRALEEYLALKAYWGVAPYLEGLAPLPDR
jgi:SAM-dependent methyltransferase